MALEHFTKSDLERELRNHSFNEDCLRHGVHENGYHTRKNPAIYCFKEGLTVSAFFDSDMYDLLMHGYGGRHVSSVRASIDVSGFFSSPGSVNAGYDFIMANLIKARHEKSFAGYVIFDNCSSHFMNGIGSSRIHVSPYSPCVSTSTLSQVGPMIECLRHCRSFVEEGYEVMVRDRA
jgi:hypothetical protein